MYLLVFVTLAISLIGLYAQILTVQTSRLAQGQTTVAEAMLNWHATAVAQARYAQPTNATTAIGCKLDNYIVFLPPVTSVPQCGNALGSVFVSPPPGLPPLCSGTQGPPCWTTLAPGTNTGTVAPGSYKFDSIEYTTAAGQNYVITFVPPPAITAPNPAPGFVLLPGTNPTRGGTVFFNTTTGITMSELYQQIKNKGAPLVSYGMITKPAAGTYFLTTAPIVNGAGVTAPIQYTLPTGLNADAFIGSIGLITMP